MAVFVHAPLTIDEFSRLPQEGEQHEMSAGELITMAPPKFSHSVIATRLFRLLIAALDKSEVSDAFAEAGYVLTRSPLTIRQPDLSVLADKEYGQYRRDNMLRVLRKWLLRSFHLRTRLRKCC